MYLYAELNARMLRWTFVLPVWWMISLGTSSMAEYLVIV
jgi:hypothetical protein